MRRVHILLIALMIIGIAFIVGQAIINGHENPANSDFFTFWLAGRLVSEGLNPFSAIDWVEGHHIYHSTWIPNLTFIYPLPLSVILVPIGLFSLKTAYILWISLTIIILFVVIGLLLPYLENGKEHYFLPILAGVILFRPLTSLLYNGQISAWLLLSFVFTTLLWERNHWFWGGVVVALSLLKPNTGLLALAFLSLYILRRKKINAFYGIGFSSILLFALGAVINPAWVIQYYSILTMKFNQIFGYAPTIWGLSLFITNFNQINSMLIAWTSIGLISITYLAIIWKNERLDPTTAVGFAVLLMLITTPSIWPYDQIILIFPNILILAMIKKIGGRYLLSSFSYLCISIISYVLFGISTRIQMENLNALLTILVLIIYTGLTLRMQRTGKTISYVKAPDG